MQEGIDKGKKAAKMTREVREFSRRNTVGRKEACPTKA